MTTPINGDDVLSTELNFQGEYPSIAAILNKPSLKSANVVDLTDYLGGWSDQQFDPTKPVTYNFTRDSDKSKLLLTNSPTTNGGLPAQSYKVSFASSDKNVSFNGNANLSDARPYFNQGEFPKSWRSNTSFSYKKSSEGIISTATVQNFGNSYVTETAPGVYIGDIYQTTNSSQSYKVGAISLAEKHVWIGSIKLNDGSSFWTNKLINIDYKFTDNSDPNAKFALSYKGSIENSINFTDFSNLSSNIGEAKYKLNSIVFSDSERNFTITTKYAEFTMPFNGDDAMTGMQNFDDYELIKESFYGDIMNQSGNQDKSMAFNILKSDNVYKSTMTSSDNGSMGSFIFTLDGKDNITGSKFDDFIMAGRDADIIKGGLGADTFSFSQYDLNPSVSTPQRMQMDIIADFNSKQGDKINVAYDSGQALIYDTLGTKAQGTMWFDKGTLWMNFNSDAGKADAGIVLGGVKSFGQSDLGVTSNWSDFFPS